VMRAPLGGGPAIEIAAGHDNPTEVVVDAAHVYWTNAGSGTVMKAPLYGGPPTVIAVGQKAPGGIAVRAAHVYRACFDRIMRAPKQEGTGRMMMAVITSCDRILEPSQEGSRRSRRWPATQGGSS